MRTHEPPWFPVAVQALIHLANADKGCSSAEMAPHLQAHAAFLRRVLAQLGRAGLISAREGRAGGYSLARPAAAITLADVYLAVQPFAGAEDEAGTCDAVNEAAPETHAALAAALAEVDGDVDRARLEVLSHYAIASILDRVHAIDREQRGLPLL
jgi:Rrf2 family protein